MKHLIIIGARGYGCAVFDMATTMKGYGSKFIIKGFLDDNTNALNDYDEYPPIIASVENYSIQPEDVFICALGDVRYKKKYAQMIVNKGGKFINVIHETAYIGKNVKLGKGCIVGAYSKIDCDVEIGDFVCIQDLSAIGHDSKIGDWCMLDSYTFTGGFSLLGDSVTLHTRTTIIPHIHIGDNSTINVGSVVIRNVPVNSVMMGNPAKRILAPKSRD